MGTTHTEEIVGRVFALSEAVRYVAIKQGRSLMQRQRAHAKNASSSESDRYEELFINPALLALIAARGDLDCGGADFLLVRYGNFFQLILAIPSGHLSVCVELGGHPLELVDPIRLILEELASFDK